MQSIKQFQNDQKRIYASVVSEPRQSLLMDIWNGQPQTLQEMLQVMDYSLQRLKDDHINCWLSEVSKLDALFELDEDIAVSYVAKHLENTPLKRFAFIKRASNYSKLNQITQVLKDAGIEVKSFSTSVMAMQWLLSPLEVECSMPTY